MKKELDKKILKMTKFDIIDEKYIKTNTVIWKVLKEIWKNFQQTIAFKIKT